jgi:uncharacterized Ntn-hydrolase superfamily protein
MRKIIIVSGLFFFIAIACSVVGEDAVVPIHPVNTYSIIAYDPATGQYGGAVQSHWFKVADVIWLEPGVGAVATQSLVDFAYGPLGLEMMKKGKTARQALDGLLASDPDNAVRQVAMIDKDGRVVTHTGDKWEGDMAEKMMAALEAAEAEGGDIRGRQSAAMKVVTGSPTGQSWRDYMVDIRVDDSPEPLKELRRLLDISRAYDHMDRGDEYITEGDFEAANAEYSRAAELAPGNPEIRFWQAVTLVSAGQVELSLPIFKGVFEADESWRELVPRLVSSDLLPDDKDVIKRIVEQ